MSNPRRTAELWILHRDPAQRDTLARAAGGEFRALLAKPTDETLLTASPPEVIVLGLDGDLAPEFEFVHRNADRLASARWVLVTHDHSADSIRRRFDTLGAEVLAAPYSAGQLRQQIETALAARPATDSLSLRSYRDRLSERFIRWFGDLLGDDSLALLQVMDPRLAGVPLVLQGERGTGRALFARYVHTFGSDAAGGSVPFVAIDCANLATEAELLASIARARGASSATLLLERPEALPRRLRSPLIEWIEYELPPDTLPGTHVRWVASLPPGTDPWPIAALPGLRVSLPPLRERRAAIEPFVRATAEQWCRSTRRRPRTFAPRAIEALELYSWPGNLLELEGVLLRALATRSVDPIAV